jgi:hypothetical protein
VDSEELESFSDVGDLAFSYRNKQGSEFKEGSIIFVCKPTLNEDSVLRLELEVLCNIVNDNGSGNVSTYAREIFNVEAAER